MSAHAVPLHCPYCAGEHLVPHQDNRGAWECRECLRAFSVKFLGLIPQSSVSHPGGIR
jgi:transposase-like protein